ncbi:MAG: MFS transporter [Janthinobacterium lividum]
MPTPTTTDAGSPEPAVRHPRALDALNFLLADVRGALGPFLNVFLVTERGWTQSAVGLMTTIAGLLGLLVQTPIGAAIDSTPAKRGAVVAALVVLALGAATLFAAPFFWPVTVANAAMAVAGDVFGPAVAALTLGLTTRAALARRLGRSSAFDHAGNVAIALAVGGVGYALSQRAVFLLVPAFAIAAIVTTLSIPHASIDQRRARGLDDPDAAPGTGDAAQPTAAASGFRALLRSRPLMVFCLCAALFHFANAPLLPLVGQKLAAAHPRLADAMMASCIIAAQLVMLPVALLVGRTADRLGRKPIFLAAFAILPLRAVLYTLSDNSAWLIGVQLLDGVGAGIFGALAPLIIADVTRGTGRFNLAQGFAATCQGAGASLSGLAAGLLVDHAGYGTAFLSLGAAALVALVVFALAMPETRNAEPGTSPGRPSRP